MSEYKIPIIPNLNLEKNEKEKYEFNVNVGKIKSKKTGHIFEIYNIKIEIYDKIDIYFEVDMLVYFDLFMEEIPSDNGRKFIDSSDVRFFDIECESNGYDISLLNFHLKSYTTEIKNEISNDFIFGECAECLLVKNNNFINNDEKVRVWNILECSNTSHNNFLEFESDNLSNIFLKSINTNDYYSKYETMQDFEIKHNLRENYDLRQMLEGHLITTLKKKMMLI